MNPLTNMKNVTKLSERALEHSQGSSWHNQYKDSAWIFVGGLPFDLCEGDIICIFSQYGEIVNLNLIRDKKSGKSKGFCFLCYEDQRSTILAVDNFNGIKVLNRILRVDHVSEYKVPKENEKTDELTKKMYAEGCAPPLQVPMLKNVKKEPVDVRETLADQIQGEIRLPMRLPIRDVKLEPKEEQRETLADQIQGEIRLPMRLPIRDVKQEPKKEQESSEKSKDKKKEKPKKKKERDSLSDSDSSSYERKRKKHKNKSSKKRERKSSSSSDDEKTSKKEKHGTSKDRYFDKERRDTKSYKHRDVDSYRSYKSDKKSSNR